jgi:glycosyltransferase involved in cell wall biosynthesis
MIFIYYDSLSHPGGGIGTYLHALALHLHQEKIPFQVTVTELKPSPIVDELIAKGIKVYRQKLLPGDRWLITKRVMLGWLASKLKPGDWVYCLCPPYAPIYLDLVRLVHWRKAKIAVSWFLAPEFWPPDIAGSHAQRFCQAIQETDRIISVSKCTVHQFKEVYGFTGKVYVVPYHNFQFFPETVDLPSSPPWKIGFMGRLDIRQKNLDTLLQAFSKALQVRHDLELHLYGGGSDQGILETLAQELNIQNNVYFWGAYDHRQDLPNIIRSCHFFVHPSRSEGGPCFSLLEQMQAGRYCVASQVGGIPDLYAGHPEAGLLVDCKDTESVYQGLTSALDKLANGLIDAEKIRSRYFDGFDMASAHRAWAEVIK